MPKKVPLNAVVTQRIELSPELIILQVTPEGWELPDFIPGQFAVLGLPGAAPRCALSDPEEEAVDPVQLIRRAYSIASSSVAKVHLEFFVTLVSDGALTPRLFALKPRDRVWLGPKITGMFTLAEVPKDKNIVMVATGTGIAPYMSMMRTLLPELGNRRYAVLHGARHSVDLGYHSELKMMDQLHHRFTYIPLISRPTGEPAPWLGRTGYVQSIWEKGVLDELWGKRPTPEDTRFFLCGNPAMCEDMLAQLEKEGFKEHTTRSPGQVHLERYW